MSPWEVALNTLIDVSHKQSASWHDLEDAFFAYCNLFSKEFFNDLKLKHQDDHHQLKMIGFFEADAQALKIEFVTLSDKISKVSNNKVLYKNMVRDLKKTLMASLMAQRDYVLPLIERV